MFNVARSIGSVLCCNCGILMQPNAANMCANCLRSEADITERRADVCCCPECRRYEQPPSAWIRAEAESKELLTLCLKKLKKSKAVRVVHAEFVWTEPHCKRIRVRLRVQKEVHGAVLEQAYTVEFVVQDKLCGSCSRLRANPDQWAASVQVRQNVSHRRTFFYLEQLILKHNAARDAVRIRQLNRGIDFYFNSESHANRFVDFVAKVAPVVVGRNNVQLVSHDCKSNKATHKQSFSVEVSPVCREDLICLPPHVASRLGNLGPLVICHKVTNAITLLDPFTLRQCFVDAKQYWGGRGWQFKALLSSRQLTEYIVLDLEPVPSQEGASKYFLADAHVARVSDFGRNDRYSTVRTHLGRLLRPGDYALGYDLYGVNSNDMGLERLVDIPDVILIKKSYKKEKRERSWKLKSLEMEARAEEQEGAEYKAFLRDLDENPELRFNLSLYSNDDDEVPLDQMFADLDLSHGDIHMAE